MSDVADHQPERADGDPPISFETHFSWLRTRMSTERALLSWVRTAVALIGFGFTIFQFFDRIRDATGLAPPRHPNAPRLIGLSFVIVGTLALALSCVEYLLLVRYLRSDEFREIRGATGLPRFTPTLSVALLVAMVGAVTVWSLVARALGN